MRRTLVLIGAVLAVFLPSLPKLSAGVIGTAESDALKHVWSQWLVRDQVLSGSLSMQTHLLNFPTGGPFFSLDTVNALLGLPLELLLPVALVSCSSPSLRIELLLLWRSRLRLILCWLGDGAVEPDHREEDSGRFLSSCAVKTPPF